MTNTNETIADIVAEMRGGSIPQHRHDRELLRNFANRIESAMKRELGNTQKMREAMAFVMGMLSAMPERAEYPASIVVQEAMDRCRQAIYESEKGENDGRH